jgi:hypothetical protein
MNSTVARSIFSLMLVVSISGWVLGQHNGTITFDVPGACQNSSSPCITPLAINQAGAVTGVYIDITNVGHAFLRDPDGSITKIDPPGSQGAEAVGIDSSGEITGSFFDGTRFHGFLRSPDGTTISFDPEGSTGTIPLAISSTGSIVGYYSGTPFYPLHGFLRATDGAITTFDVPGSAQTLPVAVNPAGVIAGLYYGPTGGHNFVRSADGTIITFDPPGAIFGSFVNSINPAGVIAGSYLDANFVQHGFLRDPDGTITIVDVTGALDTTQIGGFPPGGGGLTPGGTIAGIWDDSNGSFHAFVRTRNGTVTSFDGGLGSKFTQVMAINPAGVTTGWYQDTNFVNHGFVRIP